MEEKSEKPANVETPAKVEKPPKSEVLSKEVMERLGTPPDFHQIKVKNVFGNNWRVDVWTRTDAGSGVITDSFYIKLNDDDEIVSPEIKRKYK